MKYSSSGALRQALEERLRTQAIQTGMPLVRLRKMVAFERLLARLMSGKEEVWILKGGFALELRLGVKARTTNDLDLLTTIPLSPKRMHQAIAEAALTDLKDAFQFQVRQATTVNPARFTVQSLLDGRNFETFHLDVGTGDPIVGPPEYITTPNLLAFADIPPVRVPCYPLTQQLAEKVHASTLTYKSGETTRVKDWVDILLIAQTGNLSAKRLSDSLQATFSARQTHPLPEKMPLPPPGWARIFKKQSGEVQLGNDSLEEASEAVSEFLDPILSGQASGQWNPTSWRWE
jgi:hypothetical protein